MVDAQESVDAAREAVAEGVKTARDRFQRLSSDVQDRYEKVSDDVRRGAERAQKQYRDVADKATRGYEKARTATGQFSRDVGDYVKDNPGKSVLIAAGVGFLLGLLVRRGSDEE